MRIESHRAAVTAIIDLQDGRGLASGSYDKTINIYSLINDGKLAYSLPANKTSVTALLLNANASKMISCGLDDTLSIWQIVRGAGNIVETMFIERIIQNNTMICSLTASVLRPELVLLGAKDGKVKVIDIDRGQASKSLTVCSNAIIEMVVVERATKPGNSCLM
jgi:WD40 repeat protein